MNAGTHAANRAKVDASVATKPEGDPYKLLLAAMIDRLKRDACGHIEYQNVRGLAFTSEESMRLRYRMEAMDWFFLPSDKPLCFVECMRYLGFGSNGIAMARRSIRRQVGEFYNYWAKERGQR